MIQFELLDPSRLVGMDLGRTIRRGIKSQAEALRDAQLGRVLDRTPQWTGALKADETGTFDTDTDSDELIHVFTGTSNQLDAWNRVYAMYVEGPDIGVNGMWDSELYNADGGFDGHHMFGAAETQDLDLYEKYGVQGLEQGIADIVSGKGYRL